MTTLQKNTRANFVRQRRSTQTRSTPAAPRSKTPVSKPRASSGSNQTARRSYRPDTVFLPVEPRRAVSHGSRVARGAARNGFEFSVGGASVHAPVLTLPQFGPRWVSGALFLVAVFMLYTLWSARSFTVSDANVIGNQRLDTVELNAMLGMKGQPIVKVIPSALADNLRKTFTELSSVSVSVGFPNQITVKVVERVPVLAWYQDGVMTWIDADGVSFKARDGVPGLVQVSANTAPALIPLEAGQPSYEQKFIDPQTVQALLTLAPVVPSGMPMIFDPVYGMGWQDPGGWIVYFGHNTQDMTMKRTVYQAIVDKLTLLGIQPTLISVEYLNAPFYK